MHEIEQASVVQIETFMLALLPSILLETETIHICIRLLHTLLWVSFAALENVMFYVPALPYIFVAFDFPPHSTL